MAARFMGSWLSRLERTPDKREVGGSSPLEPIVHVLCISELHSSIACRHKNISACTMHLEAKLLGRVQARYTVN